MAKCSRCGKKGFFLRVNKDGLCLNCQHLLAYENEKAELEQQLSLVKNQLADTTALFENIKQEAIEAATKEIDQLMVEKQGIVADLTEKVTILSQEYDTLSEKTVKTQKTYENKVKKCKSVVREMEAINYTIEKYLNDSYQLLEIPGVSDDAEIVQDLHTTVELKLHCMDVKQLRKEYNDIQKQIKDTLEKYESRYTTKTNKAIYQLMVLALEAELQNILFDLRFGKLDDALNNIKSMTQKYISIASNGNQNIAGTIIKFVGELEYLFCEAVKVEYEYHSQKERIKEEQRALREQMRQEAEERKILEQQKKQVEKEESKYKNEMASLQEQLKKTAEQEKIDELNKRLEELQAQLNSVEEKKEDIVSRQNGKAGYVYVISNKGSFGDDVFKIGMTRRLDPQDRIDELGNASVPFPFDVHSFIFSDDAVGLERNIHVTLNNDRVNKVNLRKEFFRLSIDRLEELVYELQPTAEFNRTMMAEQYNQSISMSQPLNSFIDETDIEEIDE